MNSWSVAKIVLVLAGVVLVMLAYRMGAHVLGWAGLGLILAAFFLRFWQRAKAQPRNGSSPSP